jgi:hypothetical protein
MIRAWDHAQRRHDILRLKGHEVCDSYLAWLASAQPAKAGIDYISIDAEALESLLNHSPNKRFDRPLLVKDTGSRSLYSNQDFVETMKYCLTSGKFEVVTPLDEQERQFMSAEQLKDLLERPILGLNALSLSDFAGPQPLPEVLMRWRFKWLTTIQHSIQIAEAGNAGKSTDVGACLRFNLFACEGAYSGPHCDALCGTWLRPLTGPEIGSKLMMYIRPEDMQQSDWEQLQRWGDRWVPPPGYIRYLLIPKGSTWITFPHLMIVHAVGTTDTTVMDGGMFWDMAEISQTQRNLNWLARNQNSTNEAQALDLHKFVEEQAKLVEAHMPSLWADEEFQQGLSEFRTFRCDCKRGCYQGTCPCAKDSRRCNRACSTHETRTKCFSDRWWDRF